MESEGSKKRSLLGRDRQDWMLKKEIFKELDAAYGPFTVDACADPSGDNAHVPRFYHAKNSFLKADVSGETVWMNPPYANIQEFLDHYFKCKASAPASTAGMFVLPKWTGAPWWPLVERMERVKEYGAGYFLFTAPAEKAGGKRKSIGPAPWPVVVVRDAAELGVATPAQKSEITGEELCTGTSSTQRLPSTWKTDTARTQRTNKLLPLGASATKQAREEQLIVLHGRCNGEPVRVLVDCGASTEFMSTECCERMKAKINVVKHGEPREIELGDGTLSPATEKAFNVKLSIGSYHRLLPHERGLRGHQPWRL